MKQWHWSVIGWMVYAAGLLFVFVLNQWSNQMADPDAFYHMKMAQLLWQSGVVWSFPWLPYTTLANHFIDQHFLFHLLMIPAVAWWPDPFSGVKALTALLGVGMILVFGLTIKRLRWFGGLPLSVILALTITFSFRLQLVKATPLALIVLLLGIICLVEKRYWWLAVVSAVYVWTYGGFIMIIAVVAWWSVTQLATLILQRRWQDWQQVMWPLLAVLGGCGLGIMVNPYFPTNLWFYWEQVVQIGIVNYRDVISVGSEWYPYDLAQLWLGSTLLVITVIVAITTRVLRRIRWQQLDWFALGLAMFGLVLTLKSRRYVEYWGPFTLLACAVWLRDWMWTWSALWHYVEQQWRQLLVITAVSMLVVMSLIPVLMHDVEQNQADSRSGVPITHYQAAGIWLQQHTPAGSIILHSDWDDFPELFYYNDQARYMAGLDPTFMYRADPQRYQLWVDITTGQYHGDLQEALQTLDADYILIENDHTAMDALFKRSGLVELVYHDAEVRIYQVNYNE